MQTTQVAFKPQVIRHTSPCGSKRRNTVIKSEKKFWNNRVKHHDPGHNHSALSLTISSNFGMFTDIASQPSSPVSYPIPTYGALVNILRHLAPHLKVDFIPLGVEILNPVKYTKFAFNLSATGRKTKHEIEGSNSMFHHMILEKPRFRVYFALIGATPSLAATAIYTLQRKVRSGNHRALCMGQRDFPLDVEYSNPEEPVRTEINFLLPSMLKQVHYGSEGEFDVFTNVICQQGVVAFPTTAQTVSQIHA